MDDISASDATLFAAALDRPPAERAAFLEEACAGDTARRERIAALLDAHEQPMDLMPAGRLPGGWTTPLSEVAGSRVGRYRLLQKIGEGGCGVVFMADQEEPIRRRVALKVIKAGMDTREVIARFEAERQALALMDHPGIAKVLDAGATESGRPYFVMELVRGVPITKYCDEQNLTTPQRLQLFIEVCHAVQHAHQKGIIHRDLKPANILVTMGDDGPAPKVIDFGIAKATQGRLTDKTLFTAFQQFIGTPAYMSPEQAELSSLDVDTRSDVYSLGVLLYELLTGSTPFDPRSLGQAGLDEIRRIIREVEPPKPSTQLATMIAPVGATVAQRRGTDPARLLTMLSGDLDWIVMKALEKNRSRRYETPTALAADVQHYLRHEPVSARPPGRAYRLGKSIRRHRVAFATVSAVGLALLAGTITSTWQLMRARRAEHVAEEARQKAVGDRARADDLLDFMLGDFRAQVQKVGNIDLLEAVGDKAMAYFASLDLRELNDVTLRQHARVLTQIGENRMAQMRYPDAAQSFQAAYDRAAALVVRNPRDGDMLFERGQAEYWIGVVHRKRGEFPAARQWFVRYRDTGVALAAIDPNRTAWQSELAFGHQVVAVADADDEHTGAAREGFSRELALLMALQRSAPGDRTLQSRIAKSNSWLGSLAERDGDFAEASNRFAAQVKGIEALAAAEPKTARWQEELADALALHASTLAIRGELTFASARRAEARRVLDALAERDPQNRAWLIKSWFFRLKEARLIRAQGDARRAAAIVRDVRRRLEQFALAAPTDRDLLARWSVACRLDAEMCLAAGQREEAREAAEKAIELRESLIAQGRASEADLGEAAQARIVAGHVAAEAGDPQGALRHWRTAAQNVEARVAGSNYWMLLDPAARAFALAGRIEDSRAIVARLQRFGYVPLEPWPEEVAALFPVQK